MMNRIDQKYFRELVNEACRLCEISQPDFFSPSRRPECVLARNMVIMNLRQQGYSLCNIARAVGRNHSTVLHSMDYIERIKNNPTFLKENDILRQFILKFREPSECENYNPCDATCELKPSLPLNERCGDNCPLLNSVSHA